MAATSTNASSPPATVIAGQWTGEIIKPLPNPQITIKQVNEYSNLTPNSNQNLNNGSPSFHKFMRESKQPFLFKKVNYSPFPSCCGTALIHGFPYSLGGQFNTGCWSSDGNIVKVTKRNDMTGFILYLNQFIREIVYGRNRKSYALCTLNAYQMKAGCSEVLVDYLNFVRLDDDFINRSGSQNVGVFGACLNRYSTGNL